MAGLFLGGSAQASLGGPYTSTPNPQTVTEAAWGQGNAVAPSGGVSSLMPTNAAGIAFWTGVAGLGFLLVLRHSLPR